MGKDVPDTPRPPLAEDEVRFVGDPVALVVAEDRYVAEDAAELVDVDYEPLAAGRRLRRRARGAERAGARRLSRTTSPGRSARPLPDGWRRCSTAAAHVVAVTIFQQAYAPVPMETRGIVAEWSRRAS